MFGLLSALTGKRTPTETPTPTVKLPFQAEKLQEVFVILRTVGLDEGDLYGLGYHAQKPDNYFGGSFEWTIREMGIRYLFWGYDRPRVRVVKHGFTLLTEEEIEAANAKLEAIFA